MLGKRFVLVLKNDAFIIKYLQFAYKHKYGFDVNAEFTCSCAHSEIANTAKV